MTNPGRDLAKLRKKVSHTCPMCGEAFTGYTNAKHCSPRCRQRARRDRMKQAQKSPGDESGL